MTNFTKLLTLPLLAVMMALFPATASAEDFSAADRAEFERIINTQISAFHADDGTKAFSFATPTLQKRFANPANFMRMVKTGYPAVYRAKSVNFEGISDELGKPTQRVAIIGPDGDLWLALYGFQKQSDGSWRISAVVIRKAPSAAA